MRTRIFHPPFQHHELEIAARILRENGLVVFPTETVYGLGANALCAEAVQKIFLAKGRPSDNPLIVHIADLSMLPQVTARVPEAVYRLFSLFAPGPLTVICEKHPELPEVVTAGLPTVGIRIPSHPLARQFITLAGVPVAAPSANLSGRPSPTNCDMAIKDMDGRVDAIIDGGECEHGLESTVVMIQGNEVVILRPGAITEEMFLEHGFSVRQGYESTTQPLSPGMKYTHYKPHAEVWLAQNWDTSFLLSHFRGKRLALVGLSVPQGPWKKVIFPDISRYAKELFATFANLEKEGIEVIILEAVPEKGVGRALMNRMRKAAGNQWLEEGNDLPS
ncbi:L-threonylcarbamoyladenylate synthase [Thermospira aquatica]|uniref:Threonylcarbamoyl-AMP synthase n=1 Tax=Thermospira aquatica TaxID=2828656 RepID=A0AAX3BEL1_9SPIR|nr:L-threonylcarbamoyladenylate synthase [Thermospira aquatica]URA10782.1 threonylcarbamoyl-AMP synthase [Thermospira aquatica]